MKKTKKIKIKSSWLQPLCTSPNWVSNGHWMIWRNRVTLPSSLPIDHPVADDVFEKLIGSGIADPSLIQFRRTDWTYRSSFRLFTPIDTVDVDVPASLWLGDDYVSSFEIESIWAPQDTRQGVMCLDATQPGDVRFALMSCVVGEIDLAPIHRLVSTTNRHTAKKGTPYQ